MNQIKAHRKIRVKRLKRSLHSNTLAKMAATISRPPMSGVPAFEAVDNAPCVRGLSRTWFTYSRRMMRWPKSSVMPNPVSAAQIARKLRYWKRRRNESASTVSNSQVTR